MISCARSRNAGKRSFPVLDLATGTQTDVEIVYGCKCTDIGNAQRFVAIYGHDIRYCAAQKEWYIWDGNRWAPDTTNRVYEMAKDVAQLIHAEVSFVELNDEKEKLKEQKELSKWAFTSESQYRVKAMVELAQSDPQIAVTLDQFDADGWLVNCSNGTLDLRKRQLREHRREDLITKLIAVPYEPDAESELWYKTLLGALPVDEGAFLQRAAGSALTTLNKDKALFYLYGGPNSRKSTLLDSIFAALGDYGEAFDISMFSKAPQRPGSARPDIVKLDGVRAAQCSEVPKNMVFNDALVKSMTSGNPKSARGMYEKRERKIIPVTKLFIEGNYLPHIDFDDDASFNRFFILTFLRTLAPDEIDTSIKETLTSNPDALKAIFAWVVIGCYLWQDVGLAPPESVNAARKAYQKKMNPLTSFIEAECVDDEGAETSTSELWERFKLDRDIEMVKQVPNMRSFGLFMKQFGYQKKHTRAGNVWIGVRPRDVGEFDYDEEGPAKRGEHVNSNDGFLRTFPCNVIAYMRSLQNHPSTIHLFTKPTSTIDERENLVELTKDMDEFIDMINEMDSCEVDSENENHRASPDDDGEEDRR